jgi:hypothetical protein
MSEPEILMPPDDLPVLQAMRKAGASEDTVQAARREIATQSPSLGVRIARDLMAQVITYLGNTIMERVVAWARANPDPVHTKAFGE